MSIARPRSAALVLAALALALGAAPREARPDDDSLALRVNDATGVPGGLVAVVVRTYASRPIRRGQVVLRAGSSGSTSGARPASSSLWSSSLAASAASSPLAALEGTLVMSPRNDATSESSFRDAQAVLSFSSPSGTINTADGPMAVLYFRLSRDVQPGQRFDLVLDPDSTSLVDGEGRQLEVDSRPGRLEIRAARGELELEAVDARVRAGRVAELGVETSEPAAVARGRIALRWDARLAAGPPEVRMDPRYGKTIFRVTRLGPGQVVVRFLSPDASLNRVPGRILEVRLPTAPNAPSGARSAVVIDPRLTFLEGPGGVPLPLELENGVLSIR
jgi:hypothetical protein